MNDDHFEAIFFIPKRLLEMYTAVTSVVWRCPLALTTVI